MLGVDGPRTAGYERPAIALSPWLWPRDSALSERESLAILEIGVSHEAGARATGALSPSPDTRPRRVCHIRAGRHHPIPDTAGCRRSFFFSTSDTFGRLIGNRGRYDRIQARPSASWGDRIDAVE